MAVLRSLISDVSEFAVCVTRDERSATFLSVCALALTSALMESSVTLSDARVAYVTMMWSCVA